VLPTSDQARLFYQSVAQRLEAGNDPLRGTSNVPDAREHGVDEQRDFYRVYLDSTSAIPGTAERSIWD
jgi:hypothetical protein